MSVLLPHKSKSLLRIAPSVGISILKVKLVFGYFVFEMCIHTGKSVLLSRPYDASVETVGDPKYK